MQSVVIYGKRSTVPLYHEFTNLVEASECVNELQFWLSTVDLQFLSAPVLFYDYCAAMESAGGYFLHYV